MKIYRCNKCGNILVVVNDGGVVPKCCNEDMELLKANTTDGILEKHVPVVEIYDGTIEVKVGEIEHPMIEDHYIKMIMLETDKGCCLKFLTPGEKPETKFKLCGNENPIAVYEYCNIHSLFKKDIDYEEK